MVSFQRKISKFGKDRLMIEIPKELRSSMYHGDTVVVSRKEMPLNNKDIHKLKQKLKGKLVEVTSDRGIEIREAYLLDIDDGFIVLSDKDGRNKTFMSIANRNMISIKPKIILKGYYINGGKVSKKKYRKALLKKEFSTASEVFEDMN